MSCLWKKIAVFIVLIITLPVSKFVSAAEIEKPNYGGFNFGIRYTASDICFQDNHCENLPGVTVGAKLYVGRELNENLMLEGMLFNGAKISGGLFTSASAEGGAVSLVAPLRVGNLTVKAKLGVGSVTGKTDMSAFPTESKKSVQAIFGLGTSFNFGKSVSLNLDYDHIPVKFGQSKTSIELLSLGVAYHF